MWTAREAPATTAIVRPPGGRSLREAFTEQGPQHHWSNGMRMKAEWEGEEEEVRKAEEEEQGPDLSKSDQLSKKT